MKKPSSPCVDICCMDDENRYCKGCRRTIEEIATWSVMTDADKWRVLKELPLRQH